MLFAKKYQNSPVLVEVTPCQSWHAFWDVVHLFYFSFLLINFSLGLPTKDVYVKGLTRI